MTTETTSEPLVYVVVLNWNRWRPTVACLASLEGLDYRNCRVVVADNGSDDGSVARIRERFPDVTVVENGSNLGFAGGNNAGIRHALSHGADFVWVLNNDTTVDPGALAALVREAERDPRIGIVGSALYYAREPDRLQAWGGAAVSWSLSTTKFEDGSEGPGRLDYVVGASMFVRREVFEDVGLLDPTYFFYLEDADFCYRAKRRGWKLAVAGASVVYHHVGATIESDTETRTAYADALHARSSGIFMARHAGLRLPLAVPLKVAGMTLRRARRRQLDRVPVVTSAFARGLAAGLRTSGARHPAAR